MAVFGRLALAVAGYLLQKLVGTFSGKDFRIDPDRWKIRRAPARPFFFCAELLGRLNSSKHRVNNRCSSSGSRILHNSLARQQP